MQGVRHRLRAHLCATTREVAQLGGGEAVGAGPAEADRPDRLVRRAASGAGNAGDRHRPVGPATPQRPLCHRLRPRHAHRTVPIERFAGDAEHLLLGLVRIGDEAALEPVRTAGNRRQALCNPAPSA